MIGSTIPLQAFLQMVKMERMRAEAEMKREEEERRKKREHNRRVKRVLEAAFDGDNDEIKTVLKEVHDFIHTTYCTTNRY